MAFSIWDLGGCNCPGCVPCPLPAHDLTLTFNAPGIGVFTPTLVYAAGSPDTWDSGCFVTGAFGCSRFVLGCGGGCSFAAYYHWISGTTCAGPPSSIALWESSPGCSGVTPDTPFTLGAYSCSPLSIQWLPAAGLDTWTVTP
jgi:hypothetical protein